MTEDQYKALLDAIQENNRKLSDIYRVTDNNNKDINSMNKDMADDRRLFNQMVVDTKSTLTASTAVLDTLPLMEGRIVKSLETSIDNGVKSVKQPLEEMIRTKSKVIIIKQQTLWTKVKKLFRIGGETYGNAAN